MIFFHMPFLRLAECAIIEMYRPLLADDPYLGDSKEETPEYGFYEEDVEGYDEPDLYDIRDFYESESYPISQNFTGIPTAPRRFDTFDYTSETSPIFRLPKQRIPRERESKHLRIPVHNPIAVNPNHRIAQKVKLVRGLEEDALNGRQLSLFHLVKLLFQNPRRYHMDIDHDYIPGICYRIYSVTPFAGHYASPVALFKPANLEIGTKSYKKWIADQKWWVKPDKWMHEKAFPPGTGVLREYICHLMNEKLLLLNQEVEFRIPTSLLVQIGRFGPGLLQEYVVTQTEEGGSFTEPDLRDSIIESQMQFILTILTSKSYNGLRFGRIRVLDNENTSLVEPGTRGYSLGVGNADRYLPPQNKFYRPGRYSVHNSLTFPESESLHPLTDAAMRLLRLPFGNFTFAPPIIRMIKDLDRHFFDSIYDELGVSKTVIENIEMARRVLRTCVLRHNFTPIQVIRFLYTDRPVSFFSLAYVRLERPGPHESAEFWNKFDLLLENVLKRIRPLNKYQCEHPEDPNYAECEHIHSEGTVSDTLNDGYHRFDDAIVPAEAIEGVIDRMWSNQEVPSFCRYKQRFWNWIAPMIWWIQRFFLCELRY